MRSLNKEGHSDVSSFFSPERTKKEKRKHFISRHFFLICCLLPLCFGAAYATIILWNAYAASAASELKVGVLIEEGQEEVLEGIVAAGKHLNNVYTFETTFCEKSKMCLDAFKKQIVRGIRHFILNPEKCDLVPLCNFIRNSGVFVRIVSLSKVPNQCQGILEPIEEFFEYSLSVLASRLSETGVPNAFIVREMEDEERMEKSNIVETLLSKNMTSITFILPKEFHEETLHQMISTLKQFSESPILFVSGGSFFKIIETLNDRSALQGRTILANLNSFEKMKLVGDMGYRKAAEELFLIAVSHVTDNDSEMTILKNVNLIPNERNILGVKSLLSFHKLVTNSFKDKDTTMLAGKNPYIARIRLIPKNLLGNVFIQHDPWLREGVVEVRPYNSPFHPETKWELNETHSPFKIFTKDEILQFAKDEDCTLNNTEVSAIDPSWNIQIQRTWNMSSLPTILLVPNSNSRGFTIKLICEENNGTSNLEIGCFGGSNVNKSVECTLTKLFFKSRRQIRSYNSYHVLPNNIDEIIWRERKDKLKSILPQIGACVGSAAGCSFCYVFLFHVTVDVSPGVCFGSCAVGVGGACSSLISVGVKIAYDYKYRHL